MKKFFVIPVIFLYMLAMSGVKINAHYCGKALESWSLFTKSNGCNDGECGDESQDDDGCCKDKIITAKVTNDQNHVTAFQFKIDAPLFNNALPSYFVPTNSFLANSMVKPLSYRSNAPPGLWQHIPLYKLQSSLVYYG